MTNKKLNKKSKWLKLALISTATVSTLATIPAAICAKNANKKEVTSSLNTSAPVANSNLEAISYVTLIFKLQDGDTDAKITGKTVHKVRQNDRFSTISQPTATKPGHKFMNWVDKDGNPIGGNKKLEDDLTVYAKFENDTSIVVTGEKQVALETTKIYKFTATPSGTKIKWYVFGNIAPVSKTTKATIATQEDGSAKLTANKGEENLGTVYVCAIEEDKGEPEEGTTLTTGTNILAVDIVDPAVHPDYVDEILTKHNGNTFQILNPKTLYTADDDTVQLKPLNNDVWPTGISKHLFHDPIIFGKNITTIEDNFLPIEKGGEGTEDQGFTSFNNTIDFGNVVFIGNNFLCDNTNYNQPLTFPTTLKSIGDDFLSGCTVFNSPIKFGDTQHPSKISHIGNNFMDGCTDFGKAVDGVAGPVLELPISLTKVGVDFMHNCNSQTSILIKCSVDAFEPSDGSFSVDEVADANHELNVSCSGKASFKALADEETGKFRPIANGKTAGKWLRKLNDYIPTNIQAYIEDAQGQRHFITSLEDSKICATTGEIIDDDGIHYPREEFNLKVTLSASLTEVPNNFLRNCDGFNQDIVIPESIKTIGHDFLMGCFSFNKAFTIPSTVTSIGTQFLSGCSTFNQPLTLPQGLQKIDNEFLFGCANFNQQLEIPNNVTSIGNHFLSDCSSFNQQLVIPSKVESIDEYFLSSCQAFNKPLIIPNTITETIGAGFMHDCYNMISNLTINCDATKFATSTETCACTLSDKPCITSGIPVDGTNATAFMNRFQNSTVKPFRNLIKPTIPWDDNVACIEDNEGKYHLVESLTGSNICPDDPESTNPITTKDGQSYSRETFNYKVHLNPDKVTTIPDNFLANCTSFNSEVEIPSTVTEIGNSFLYNCAVFNENIVIPTGHDVKIGASFLQECISFNQNITIPSNVTSVDSAFLLNCNNMVHTVYVNCPATAFVEGDFKTCATTISTAPCYDTGITIAGDYATDFILAYPNRTPEPGKNTYRKLIAKSEFYGLPDSLSVEEDSYGTGSLAFNIASDALPIYVLQDGAHLEIKDVYDIEFAIQTDDNIQIDTSKLTINWVSGESKKDFSIAMQDSFFTTEEGELAGKSCKLIIKIVNKASNAIVCSSKPISVTFHS